MSTQDLITILSSGALSSILVFLFRNWISERIKGSIQHEYAQKLETHKAQLHSETQTEIVRLTAQLQITAAEKNYRFSTVFTHTADAIVNTHRKLVELNDVIMEHTRLLASPDDTEKKETIEFINGKWKEFEIFYKENRIYIPKFTAQKIREFSLTLSEYVIKHGQLDRLGKAGSHSDTIEIYLRQIMNLIDTLPKLLSALEDDFQDILGFPIEKKGKSNP